MLNALTAVLVILVCCCCVLNNAIDITSLAPPDNDGLNTITIDLSSNDKLNKSSDTFLAYFNFSSKEYDVNVDVINAPGNVGFFVVQVHGLHGNFSLRNAKGDVVTGRDTGFVQVDVQKDVRYRYYLGCRQNLTGNIKVLVAVVLYAKEDPIPGGCNLTFQPEISPLQMITHNDNVVQVDAQPAAINNIACDNNTVSLDMYRFYLRETTLNEDEYFDGIVKMLTPDSIIQNAHKVPRPEGLPHGRRIYSAYVGTGAIYAIVAKYNNSVSAYIPTASYACNTDLWDDDCVAPTSTIWKMIIAILLFLGVFTLFVGHTFFNIQVFVIGAVVGFFTGSVISGLAGFFIGWQNVTISIVLAGILGIAWIICWCGLKVPILSASLSNFFIAYIICCIICYSSLGDADFIRRDTNYWLMFVSIIVFFAVLLIHTQFSHILACCFLGATAITISINHYAGGNLHYILVNNLRRATVNDFNKAIIDPVFQYTDVLLSVMWFALLGVGLVVQLKMNKGRAPFPDAPDVPPFISHRYFLPRARIVNIFNSERRPLLRK